MCLAAGCVFEFTLGGALLTQSVVLLAPAVKPGSKIATLGKGIKLPGMGGPGGGMGLGGMDELRKKLGCIDGRGGAAGDVE